LKKIKKDDLLKQEKLGITFFYNEKKPKKPLPISIPVLFKTFLKQKKKCPCSRMQKLYSINYGRIKVYACMMLYVYSRVQNTEC